MCACVHNAFKPLVLWTVEQMMLDFLLFSIPWLESLLSKKMQTLLEVFPQLRGFQSLKFSLLVSSCSRIFFSVVILMGSLSSDGQYIFIPSISKKLLSLCQIMFKLGSMFRGGTQTAFLARLKNKTYSFAYVPKK